MKRRMKRGRGRRTMRMKERVRRRGRSSSGCRSWWLRDNF